MLNCDSNAKMVIFALMIFSSYWVEETFSPYG